MATRRERILRLLETMPGLTDREITDQLEGHSALQQPINALCRRMEAQKVLKRTKRSDGLIGNYLVKDKNLSSGNTLKGAEVIKKNENSIIKVDYRKNNKLEKLIELGFEEVGHWYLNENDVAFTIEKFSRETELLYAFIVEGDVKYIGKTTQEFYRRIYLYKNCGPSQRTNMRIREKIKESLQNGREVIIYAFVPESKLMYLDIPINLAAGLEDNMIKRIDPDWNIL